MTKLTRYTSIEELKASKNSLQPQQSDYQRESELSELIAVLKSHSSTLEQSKSDKPLNQSGSGK
jgi:hypothetical protein